jgi:hypothetical protein
MVLAHEIAISGNSSRYVKLTMELVEAKIQPQPYVVLASTWGDIKLSFGMKNEALLVGDSFTLITTLENKIVTLTTVGR